MRLGASMAEDAQRRDLWEEAGYGSATTPPGDLTSPTRETSPRLGPEPQSSQERSGYWPATWRHGDEPYRHYWRVLYPVYADPNSKAHWYPKWKTSEMCRGLFGARQQARHEWIISGPRRGREEHLAHRFGAPPLNVGHCQRHGSGRTCCPVGGSGIGQCMALHNSSPVIATAIGAHAIVTAAITEAAATGFT